MKNKIPQPKLPCYCQSGLAYGVCCGQYIHGLARAPTAQALMRSRYSANCRKAYKYLMQTWYAQTRPAKLDTKGQVEWNGLEIIATNQDDIHAWVEFKASYMHRVAHGSHEHSHAHIMHEKSRFILDDNQWFYIDGEILSRSACGHAG